MYITCHLADTSGYRVGRQQGEHSVASVGFVFQYPLSAEEQPHFTIMTLYSWVPMVF